MQKINILYFYCRPSRHEEYISTLLITGTAGGAMEEDSSLITIRKEKLREIREELQINPFPYRYDVTHYSAEIFANFDEYSASQQTVSVAGRIMTVRIMGKASFCTIQDRDGKIQLYVAEKNIGETGYRLFKKLDIGDIIGARGTVRKTQMGEMTVFITELH